MQRKTLTGLASGLLVLASAGNLGWIKRIFDFIGIGGIHDDATTLWGWLMTDYFWWGVFSLGIGGLAYSYFFEQINRWWSHKNHPLLPLNKPCIQAECTYLSKETSPDKSIMHVTHKLLITNQSQTTVHNLRAHLYHVGLAGDLNAENGEMQASIAPGQSVFFELGETFHEPEGIRAHLIGAQIVADDIFEFKSRLIGDGVFRFRASGPRGTFSVGGRSSDGTPSIWPIEIQITGDNMKQLRLGFDVTPALVDNTLKLTKVSFG